MKTVFCIKGDIIYPKTREDYLASDSKFLIAHILIHKSSNKKLVGRTVTFKGSLPSCAPYFWWTGTIKRDGDAYVPYSFNSRFACKVKDDTILQVSWLKYFTRELEDCVLKQRINKYRSSLTTSTISLHTFRIQPFFCSEIINNCDYFRIEKELPIRNLFSLDTSKNRYNSEQDKSIRMLSGSKLDKLLGMQNNKPWLLCFPRWSKEMFNLKRVSYANIQAHLQSKKQHIDLHVLVALRFYTFVCKLSDKGHTLFHMGPVCQLYLDTVSKADVLGKAMQYLEYKAIMYADPEKTMFVLLEDYKPAVGIRDYLQRVRDNPRKARTRVNDLFVPCKLNCELTVEQLAFVRHIKHNKFAFLQGGPGTGKSKTGLEWLFSYFERPYFTTFTGMMVNAGQERMGNRSEVMHTIHYTFHAAKNIEYARTWLAEFDIVVIDEASNVDTKLLFNLLSVLPNACKLVLIGDLGQIFPINAGCPFHDLVNIFPQHSTSLTINKRVNLNAKLLADASACIREGNAQDIEYKDNILSFTPRTPTDIEDSIRDFCNDKSDIMKIHVVVLRNIDRHSINRRIETWLLKHGMINTSKKLKLHSKCTLYNGQKITFTKNIASKKGFDNVKNGELGQVDSFRKAKQGGTILVLTNGKKILINSEYGVPPQCVQLGYASTSNKSQGSEWPKVIFYMYDGCSSQNIWTREYPYVAISRAKEQCIIIGTKQELEHMCLKKAQKRHTVLAYLLQSLELPLIDTSDDDCIYILEKTIMPKGIPAVPLLSDFAPKKKKKKKKS